MIVGRRCRNKDEAIALYGEENIITITNKLQMMFYSNDIENPVQPLCISRGFNDKLVAYYLKSETTNAWDLWKEHCRKYKESCHE